MWDEKLFLFFSYSCEIYFEANLRLRKGYVISLKKLYNNLLSFLDLAERKKKINYRDIIPN